MEIRDIGYLSEAYIVTTSRYIDNWFDLDNSCTLGCTSRFTFPVIPFDESFRTIEFRL